MLRRRSVCAQRLVIGETSRHRSGHWWPISGLL